MKKKKPLPNPPTFLKGFFGTPFANYAYQSTASYRITSTVVTFAYIFVWIFPFNDGRKLSWLGFVLWTLGFVAAYMLFDYIFYRTATKRRP